MEQKNLQKLLVKFNANYLNKCIDTGHRIDDLDEFIMYRNAVSLSKIYKNVAGLDFDFTSHELVQYVLDNYKLLK